MTSDRKIQVAVSDLQITSLQGNQLVKGIDFHIYSGEILGLCGPSGCGKSITAMALVGLLNHNLKITAGSIVWEPESTQAKPKNNSLAQFRGHGISFIFQEPLSALNPLMSNGQQLIEQIAISQPEIDRKQSESLAKAYLAKVSLEPATEILEKYPHQLSGGQCQRLMIAMALAAKPKLLIADEPTTALDPIVQKEILDLLTQSCRTAGLSLLLITHDRRILEAYTDRIVEMGNGQLVVTTQPLSQAKKSGDEEIEVEINLPKAQKNTNQKKSSPVLVLDSLSLSYKKSRIFSLRQIKPQIALNQISLTLAPSQILAVVGPSGSGKTSLGRSLVLPKGNISGKLQFHGQMLTLKEGKIVHPRIQIVWQDAHTSLNPKMRLKETLYEVLLAQQSGGSSEQVETLLQYFGLSNDLLNMFPYQLSGGQKQRFAIIRALLAQPEVLICDEITSSVDEKTEALILDRLKQYSDSTGLAVLFITHQMHIVDQIASHVMVLDRGHCVDYGSMDEAQTTFKSEIWLKFQALKRSLF
jgi:peptide/nickel transport system ATP-binding protein